MGFGKDGRGVILTEYQVADAVLNSLATNTVVKLNTTFDSLEEDFRLIKIELDAYFKGDANEHILIGVACNELSVTEIKEALAAQPVDRNDRVEEEKSQRPVHVLGSIVYDTGVTSKRFEKTIRWTYSNGEGFCLWALNMSPDNAALNAASVLSWFAKCFGVWVT